MKEHGILIVLEGSDGSGKTTQFNLLSERLKAAGYDVEVFDFPRYEKPSSYFVKQYLNGRYGPAEDISPYTASLFYALDRYEAAKDIKAALEKGKTVLINRYVGSNMAHQGAKFDDPVEQRGFFVWDDNLEFQLLNIPRPDINIFLRVPAKTAYELISQKAQRNYTDNIRDEHESNLDHLKKSVATYDLLCQLFPKDFVAIECTKEDKLLSVPQISNLIWAKLQPMLPAYKPLAPHPLVVTLDNSVKDTGRSVGPASDKLVQDFKNASLFLKLNIERQLKSIEPAGFNIWSDNNYKFYTPMGLPKDVETAYKSALGRIAQAHQQMREKLSQYYERNLLAQSDSPPPNISSLLLPVTPLSALSNFKAELSERAVSRVAGLLLANDSQELQWAAKQLYIAARRQWPEDFKAPLESAGSPESINHIIAKIAEDRLPLNSGAKEGVKLQEALPRQEFDLLAESIYPYSNLSLEEISEEVSSWSYPQKYESLKQAVANPAILEKINYKFDVISDQITMFEIAGSAVINNLQLQMASPRYGYEVPAILEDAGIDDLYIECFDESLKLFSRLQAAEREDLSVYAALLGHKLRWQFSVNAKNMKLIFEHKGGESYQKVINSLKESAEEVHPLTWEVLSAIQTPPSQAGASKKNRVKPSKRRPSKRSRSKRPNDN